MALNTYFTNYSFANTQNLFEDLIIESIKIYGVETYYLPRTLVDEDRLFGEDDLSTFSSATQVEMYVKSVDGFEGQGEFLQTFGLEIQDEVTFTVAKSRFETELSSLDPLRPKEGDLVWFPLVGKLFEIKFVEHEEVFYQAGSLNTYELRCEQFTYSDETIDTGIADIDAIETKYTTAISLQLANTGTGEYIVGETVTGNANNVTGEVKSWSNTTNILQVIDATGRFVVNEILTGNTSNAVYTVSTTTYTKDPSDPLDGGDIFQGESDQIFDFSETDPFSEGTY